MASDLLIVDNREPILCQLRKTEIVEALRILVVSLHVSQVWCFAPLYAGAIRPSFLLEINPGCSLDGKILKLKCFSIMRRENSLEKTLMTGEIEGRKVRQMMKLLDSVTKAVDRFMSILANIQTPN